MTLEEVIARDGFVCRGYVLLEPGEVRPPLTLLEPEQLEGMRLETDDELRRRIAATYPDE
jgi:hypothetical protein